MLSRGNCWGSLGFVLSLQSACQRRPPPGGQDGQMDVAGLSNACSGLWGAPCALIIPPGSVLTAVAANSALTKLCLQFDPLPGLLPPLTKSLAFAHPLFIIQAPSAAPWAWGLSPARGAELSLPPSSCWASPGCWSCSRAAWQKHYSLIL